MWRSSLSWCYFQNRLAGDQRYPHGRPDARRHHVGDPWCRIICMSCQQTLPKHLFANVNMMSYCDVTNSIYPVTMTIIRHCSILEFGRGHTIKQSLRPSLDLCTPLVHPKRKSEPAFCLLWLNLTMRCDCIILLPAT